MEDKKCKSEPLRTVQLNQEASSQSTGREGHSERYGRSLGEMS